MRTIFFDVDGVLIDGWHADEALRKPWDANLEADLGVDHGAFQATFFGSRTDGRAGPFMDVIVGRRDLKDALAETLPGCGYEGSVDAFVDYWFENDSNVNTAVLEVVKQLKSVPDLVLRIATGQEHHRARYLWETLGFRDHFSSIYYTAQIGALKHDPAFFHAVNDRLGITPDDRPLFFDDKALVVAAATEAGWEAVLFATVDDLTSHPFIAERITN